MKDLISLKIFVIAACLNLTQIVFSDEPQMRSINEINIIKSQSIVLNKYSINNSDLISLGAFPSEKKQVKKIKMFKSEVFAKNFIEDLGPLLHKNLPSRI
jgi:hypothetical protein